MVTKFMLNLLNYANKEEHKFKIETINIINK